MSHGSLDRLSLPRLSPRRPSAVLPMLALCGALACLASPAPAVGEEQTAAQWLQAGAEQLTTTSARLDLRLVHERKGATREVTLETATSRRDPEVVKTWILQTGPELHAGTQFLTLTRPDDEEQYRYLPVTGAVSRVQPTENFSLFGTDFQIRDIEVADPAEGTHTILGPGTVTVGGTPRPVTRIESRYDSGKHRRVVRSLDDEHKLPLLVEYFDKSDSPTKRLTVLTVAADSAVPVATHSRMENLKRGSTTDLYIDRYAFDLDEDALPEATFTKEQILKVGVAYSEDGGS